MASLQSPPLVSALAVPRSVSPADRHPKLQQLLLPRPRCPHVLDAFAKMLESAMENDNLEMAQWLHSSAAQASIRARR
ncbi:Ankyrin repeat-containing protein [Globisporangium polare]